MRAIPVNDNDRYLLDQAVSIIIRDLIELDKKKEAEVLEYSSDKLFDYVPHTLKYLIREISLNRYTRRKKDELDWLKQYPSNISNESIQRISSLLRRKDRASLLMSAAITSMYNREYLSNFKKLNSIVLYSSGTKYRIIQELNMFGLTYDIHSLIRKFDDMDFVKDFNKRVAEYIKSLHPDFVHTILDNLVFKTKRIIYTVNGRYVSNKKDNDTTYSDVDQESDDDVCGDSSDEDEEIYSQETLTRKRDRENSTEQMRKRKRINYSVFHSTGRLSSEESSDEDEDGTQKDDVKHCSHDINQATDNNENDQEEDFTNTLLTTTTAVLLFSVRPNDGFDRSLPVLDRATMRYRFLDASGQKLHSSILSRDLNIVKQKVYMGANLRNYPSRNTNSVPRLYTENDCNSITHDESIVADHNLILMPQV